MNGNTASLYPTIACFSVAIIKMGRRGQEFVPKNKNKQIGVENIKEQGYSTRHSSLETTRDDLDGSRPGA